MKDMTEHVARMRNIRSVNNTVFWENASGKKSLGRPRSRR
jgi:hypothetical protein